MIGMIERYPYCATLLRLFGNNAHRYPSGCLVRSRSPIASAHSFLGRKGPLDQVPRSASASVSVCFGIIATPTCTQLIYSACARAYIQYSHSGVCHAATCSIPVLSVTSRERAIFTIEIPISPRSRLRFLKASILRRR
jgi:hypothetical protein